MDDNKLVFNFASWLLSEDKDFSKRLLMARKRVKRDYSDNPNGMPPKSYPTNGLDEV